MFDAAALAPSPSNPQQLKDWLDAGDIIGVRGSVKRTEKGEMSVYVREWQMLTKSLLPMPDKWHGLTDVNKRYRQRHLDLIVNPQVKQTFVARAKMTSSLRRRLDELGFVEIETPILQTSPGGADAKPFETYHNALEMNLTLRIATELHLKRLMIGGFDKGKCSAVGCALCSFFAIRALTRHFSQCTKSGASSETKA